MFSFMCHLSQALGSWIKPQFRCPSEVLPSVTWVGLFSQLKGVCVCACMHALVYVCTCVLSENNWRYFCPCCLCYIHASRDSTCLSCLYWRTEIKMFHVTMSCFTRILGTQAQVLTLVQQVLLPTELISWRSLKKKTKVPQGRKISSRMRMPYSNTLWVFSLLSDM